MTDIPQKYTDEAIRRMNEERETRGYAPGYYHQNDHTTTAIVTLARTLKELNWEPPVDPLLLRAREIVAEVNDDDPEYAHGVRAGDWDDEKDMKIALTALKGSSNA